MHWSTKEWLGRFALAAAAAADCVFYWAADAYLIFLVEETVIARGVFEEIVYDGLRLRDCSNPVSLHVVAISGERSYVLMCTFKRW
jgi:hypothetical protein